jgi:basic membrane lipoprotein Med (substrate-binding protein (PBP1-ABC) superfamily)
MKSFFGGASWQAGPEMKFMNNFINAETTEANVPSSTDPTQGKETALKLIGNGCDVLFAIGGDAVNGVLLAARENNLPAVGADVDEYNTYPEVQSALISSGRATTNQDVVNAVKRVFPDFEVELPGGHMPGLPETLWYFDITRVREDTGFEPAFSLEAGIADYISWLQAGNAE